MDMLEELELAYVKKQAEPDGPASLSFPATDVCALEDERLGGLGTQRA